MIQSVLKANWLTILCCLLIFTALPACKNKQKIAEQQNLAIKQENAQKAKSMLNSILNDNGDMTLAEKRRIYNQVMGINSDDPEVLDLIAQVEQQLAREENNLPLASEPETKTDEELTMEAKIAQLFDQVAQARSVGQANTLIDQGLRLFTTPNAPVLIIINKSGDIKDYDEPTTIQNYLNYLKDQKESPNAIFNMVQDSNGLIQELELIKR